MRLWSLHPSYLDSAGLVALWREGLLARKVLSGHTKGYIHHPQLHRFRETPHPLQTLDAYLKAVYDESLRRGYHFDPQKITPMEPLPLLLLPDKQLEYEFRHLLNKLRKRDLLRYASLLTAPFPPPPLSGGTGGNVPLGKTPGGTMTGGEHTFSPFPRSVSGHARQPYFPNNIFRIFPAV